MDTKSGKFFSTCFHHGKQNGSWNWRLFGWLKGLVGVTAQGLPDAGSFLQLGSHKNNSVDTQMG